MTIGEKIQVYRKKLNFSQEELGQKLLVSRQTISLWEKDQTVPTIDNLLRLREIFGVTVDEILGFESNVGASADTPLESYRFNFAKTELRQIRRRLFLSSYKKPLIQILFWILAAVLLEASSDPELVGLFIGILLVHACYLINGLIAYIKGWKRSIERISKSTYEYELFDDHIKINIYRENEKVRESKCYNAEIEQCRSCGKWLVFQHNGQSFFARTCDLPENSVFYSYLYNDPSKTAKRIPQVLNILSIVLFVASILSISAGFMLWSLVTQDGLLSLWAFFLPLLIPIASIVIGIVLKKRGCSYKKNIIIGIIMTVLLCCFGSFHFVVSDMPFNSDEYILRAEQVTDIDLPEFEQITAQDWTRGTQTVPGGYIYNHSAGTISSSAAEEFEQQIATDEKWLSELPSAFVGILSPLNSFAVQDYTLLYNIDTSEFNTLPAESGTYHFISITYSVDTNYMSVDEYDIDYVK